MGGRRGPRSVRSGSPHRDQGGPLSGVSGAFLPPEEHSAGGVHPLHGDRRPAKRRGRWCVPHPPGRPGIARVAGSSPVGASRHARWADRVCGYDAWPLRGQRHRRLGRRQRRERRVDERPRARARCAPRFRRATRSAVPTRSECPAGVFELENLVINEDFPELTSGPGGLDRAVPVCLQCKVFSPHSARDRRVPTARSHSVQPALVRDYLDRAGESPSKEPAGETRRHDRAREQSPLTRGSGRRG